MREAVHIFLKDSRYLRVPIALVLAWTVLLVLSGGSPVEFGRPLSVGLDSLSFLVRDSSEYVLPIGWTFLIVRAFHAEALPGDRQFWLTRPYRRASLFGAKALFVFAYVTVPFALAQMAIVVPQGFPWGSSVAGMMWSHVLIWAVIVLPAAALASVTSKLAQFVIVAFAAPLLGALAYDTAAEWGPFAWIRTSLTISVAVAVAGTVLFVQFTRRRTGVSRSIAIAGIVAIVASLALAPWSAAFAFQSRVGAELGGEVTAKLVPQPAPDPRLLRLGVLSFELDGLPADTLILCDATEATIEGAHGSWKTGLQFRRGDTVSKISDGCTMVLSDASVSEAGTRPVSIHAVVYVTVLGVEQPHSIPIDQPPTFTSNAGLCSGSADRALTTNPSERGRIFVTCLSAFRDPRALSALPESKVRVERLSYSPFPADLRILPLEWAASFSSETSDAMTIVTRHPVAHVKVTVEARGVNLQDYLR